MSEMKSTLPDFRNPFDIIAYVLMKLRLAYEGKGTRDIPRWVRIARANKYTGPISTMVKNISLAATQGLTRLVTLTVRLQAMLAELDSAVATAEVTLEMIDAFLDPSFMGAINQMDALKQSELSMVADSMKSFSGAMDSAQAPVNKIKDVIKFVPKPEDLNRIGHELFRLLHCELETDGLAGGETGKLRLLQWSFDQTLKVYSATSTTGEFVEINSFGSRRYEPGAAAGNATEAAFIYNMNKLDSISIYNFSYGTGKKNDTGEAKSLLNFHGYNGNLDKATLLKFQKFNKLPMTGRLDNYTINRLLYLDYETKNVTGIKDAETTTITNEQDDQNFLGLVNGGAEMHSVAGLTLPKLTDPPTASDDGMLHYSYCTLPDPGKPIPKDYRGWLSNAGPNQPNFVVLRSRNYENLKTNNKRYSEGEASTGKFFFAAYQCQPWVGGRHQTVPISVYSKEGKTDAQLAEVSNYSHMYQWVNVTDMLTAFQADTATDKTTISFAVHGLLRSLFSEWNVDKGRLRLVLCTEPTITEHLEVKFDKNSQIQTSLVPAIDPVTKKECAVASEYWPEGDTIKAYQSIDVKERHNVWFSQRTPLLTLKKEDILPTTKYWLLVIAEGQHRSELDVDAYFDEIKLWYEKS